MGCRILAQTRYGPRGPATTSARVGNDPVPGRAFRLQTLAPSISHTVLRELGLLLGAGLLLGVVVLLLLPQSPHHGGPLRTLVIDPGELLAKLCESTQLGSRSGNT